MNKKLFWVFALSSAVYFIQGIEGLPSQALFYYFKESLNFSPEKIMLLSSLIMLAWLVKPLIGYLVDNFLDKKSWILIALGLDTLIVFFLNSFSLPLFFLIAVLFVNSTDSAFRDVSVDGIMCVEGKKNQATGRIQSVQWMSISIAGIISGVLGGYIASKWDYKIAFLCLIPFYFLAGLTAFLYKENRLKTSALSRSSLKEDLKKIFFHKQFLILGLFIFLYRYSPSFGTPLLFIQRDEFKWNKLWIGTLGTIGTFFGIIGSLLYYKFSRKINIKKWLFWSVFLGAITTLSYLYYTPVTAIAYDAIFSFIGMFIFIMALDFMARNTIAGLEATSFAFLCSISNLALVASNVSGAFLLPIIGLKWLIIISAATSFLCLPLINKIQD